MKTMKTTSSVKTTSSTNTVSSTITKGTVKTMKRLLGYMSDYKLRLTLVFVCMIAGSAASVRATYYLRPLINDCLVPMAGQSSPDLTPALHIFIMMACMYAASVAATAIQGFIMVSVSNDVMKRVRNDMFAVMEKLPLAYFNTHSRGQIMSYYSADVDALSNMLRQSFPRIIEGITTIITILVTILSSDLRMAGVVIGCVAAIALTLRQLSVSKSKFFADQQSQMQELNAYGEEMISGRAEVKAFSQEKRTAVVYSEISGRLFGSMSKADFYTNSMYDVASGLSYAGYTAVAVAGCVMSLAGLTDAGTVGVFLQYYRKLLAPVTRITKQVNNVFSAKAGAERIFGFLDLAEEPDEGEIRLVPDCSPAGEASTSDHRSAGEALAPDCSPAGEVSCSCTVTSAENAYSETSADTAPERRHLAWHLPDGTTVPCRGRIEFSHVNFAYETDGPMILKDLSLTAEAGQTIAIVGTTGAGKTTVVNLLSRFYEIASGTIEFDGIDIRDIRKEDLRHAAGCVLQDTHLFSMSVRDNILFGRLDATEEEIKKAAGLANADRFISLLESGYDTMLAHDGSTLSQGQRQLLAIARAAAGEFPVLVLDEATSSIDSRTELLVSRGLDALMKGKTVIVIAHRLSTIRNADRIIVLDKGAIAESGTHVELMEQNGIYHSLYSSTAGK